MLSVVTNVHFGERTKKFREMGTLTGCENPFSPLCQSLGTENCSMK